MGFPAEACKKGVYYTKNAGFEQALNWVMEHMEDADFASPLVTATQSTSGFQPDEGSLDMIMSMGFTRDQATLALKETSNNVERAADWIFSHQPELDSLVASFLGNSSDVVTKEPKPLTDGLPKYFNCLKLTFECKFISYFFQIRTCWFHQSYGVFHFCWTLHLSHQERWRMGNI